MVDIMKSVKWVIGWKSKEEQAAARQSMSPEELQNRMLPREKVEIKGKRFSPAKPLIYPLPPVDKPIKFRKLPQYLIPTRKKEERKKW